MAQMVMTHLAYLFATAAAEQRLSERSMIAWKCEAAQAIHMKAHLGFLFETSVAAR